MRYLLILTLSTTAFAREGTGPWNLRAHCQRLLARWRGPSRDRMLEVVLRANAEAPQRDDFIYLAALAEYLQHPLRDALMLEAVTRREIAALARAMDRAHAAYGVPAGSANAKHAIEKVTSPERIAGLLQSAMAGIALVLESLRDEVKGMPFEHRRIYVGHSGREYFRLTPAEQRIVGAANEDYFVFGSRERREKFADWGRRLAGVLARPEIREAARRHRGSVAELMRLHGFGTEAFAREHDRRLSVFATQIVVALQLEFGGAPADEPIWKVLRDFQISMFARLPTF